MAEEKMTKRKGKKMENANSSPAIMIMSICISEFPLKKFACYRDNQKRGSILNHF